VRVWWVDFSELDDQRVLGQHQEIHMLHSLIVGRRNPWGGFLWRDEPFIISVHNRIVVEMEERGWFGHKTPMETTIDHGWDIDETIERLNTKERIQTRVKTDRWHLWLRWQGEYQGRIPISLLSMGAKKDYKDAHLRYQAQGGCLHDGPTEDIGEGRRLCLLCKWYYWDKDGTSWFRIERGKRQNSAG